MIERELIASQQELLQKIVSKAKELFLSIGIRSITMEDVAKSLGISKKTISTLKLKVCGVERSSSPQPICASMRKSLTLSVGMTFT